MIFVPRPWQQPIIGHITQHDRCNVFARPGMGKTAATLASLDALALTTDVWPALVVAPMRVANSVWSAEVARWAQFKGLRVSKVLGTREAREAALRAPADLYTIHYGLLQWLIGHLDGRWPFRTTIADESTALKSQRCSYQRHKESGKIFFRSGGSSNAAALASVARKSKHWINLTGTPAPNGLQDLWGQHWFVDFGSALGGSYTAFTDRWFYQKRGTSKEAAVFEPLPHAYDEITERIRPTTISLDPRDWFDLREPRFVTKRAELPEHLMKQYRKLHRDAFVQLTTGGVIDAVNAGVKTLKCTQYSSGNVLDEHGKLHHVHDLKPDLLEELVEGLGGAPLIVVYHFRADLDAIQRRFPKAVLLPSGEKQKAVEDAWNAGKIQMLVLSAQSAGHGLNLQHGGCDICIYTPTWNLEHYEQVIERIGPMRQMQAGYNRVVSVYALTVAGTFDEIIAERLRTKSSVQEAVMRATRHA